MEINFSWVTQSMKKHRRREGWRRHFTPLVQKRETKAPTYHQVKHPIDWGALNKGDGERGNEYGKMLSPRGAT